MEVIRGLPFTASKTVEIRDEPKKSIHKPSLPSSDFSISQKEIKEIVSPALSGRSSFDEMPKQERNENNNKSLKLSEKTTDSNNTAFSMDFKEEKGKSRDYSRAQQSPTPENKAEEIIKSKIDFLDNTIKFKSFDLLRLIGKGSFGQVFLVNNFFFFLSNKKKKLKKKYIS